MNMLPLPCATTGVDHTDEDDMFADRFLPSCTCDLQDDSRHSFDELGTLPFEYLDLHPQHPMCPKDETVSFDRNFHGSDLLPFSISSVHVTASKEVHPSSPFLNTSPARPTKMFSITRDALGVLSKTKLSMQPKICESKKKLESIRRGCESFSLSKPSYRSIFILSQSSRSNNLEEEEPPSIYIIPIQRWIN
jgi:hypothetical protein